MSTPLPRRRPILALLGANAISMSGNVAALVAIPWFVLETTGSPTRTGITAFFALLPVVLTGIFGGPIVDRVGYRRMSVISDVASGVTVAAIPLIDALVGIAFWQLLVLVFLGGLLDAPGTTARAALVPDMARLAGWSNERASGATAAVERSSRLAGAPVAGVLVAVVGAANVLWIDAATFFVSALLVAVAVPRVGPKAPVEEPAYVRDLWEGFAFLGGDRALAAMVALVAITNTLDAVSIVALPVYADQVYGSPVSLGLFTGALGAGSVVGALAFAGIGERLSRRRILTWGFVAVTAWYFVAIWFPPLPVMLAAFAFTGLAAGPLNPVIDTVFYERVPDGMRGRVFGVVRATAWVAMPLGVLVAGPLLEVAGLGPTLAGTGLLYLGTTLVATASPALRGLDALQPPATAGRIETVSPSATVVSSDPR